MSSDSEDVVCSVLIPILNEARFIEPMVAALRSQQVAGRLEFLFAYGDSTDGTTEILHRLALEDDRIQLHHNPRGTSSSGLNVVLGAARGTWVARMDGHSVYPPNYVSEGIARLEAGGTAWVSGPQRPRGHNSVSRAIVLALNSPLGGGGSRKWGREPTPGDEFELDTGVFCGVWRRDTLMRHGGWDERWHSNEDSELASRFFRRGERLICRPSMTADYTPRDSLVDLWHQYREYGRFRALTARRHPCSMRRSHLLPSALVATLWVAATRSPGMDFARAICGIYGAALAGEGLRAWRVSDAMIDAALVPVVLATMHSAYGYGQLAGGAENGVPWAALAGACGLHGLRDLLDLTDEVFAPSLELR